MSILEQILNNISKNSTDVEVYKIFKNLGYTGTIQDLKNEIEELFSEQKTHLESLKLEDENLDLVSGGSQSLKQKITAGLLSFASISGIRSSVANATKPDNSYNLRFARTNENSTSNKTSYLKLATGGVTIFALGLASGIFINKQTNSNSSAQPVIDTPVGDDKFSSQKPEWLDMITDIVNKYLENLKSRNTIESNKQCINGIITNILKQITGDPNINTMYGDNSNMFVLENVSIKDPIDGMFRNIKVNNGEVLNNLIEKYKLKYNANEICNMFWFAHKILTITVEKNKTIEQHTNKISTINKQLEEIKQELNTAPKENQNQDYIRQIEELKNRHKQNIKNIQRFVPFLSPYGQPIYFDDDFVDTPEWAKHWEFESNIMLAKMMVTYLEKIKNFIDTSNFEMDELDDYDNRLHNILKETNIEEHIGSINNWIKKCENSLKKNPNDLPSNYRLTRLNNPFVKIDKYNQFSNDKLLKILPYVKIVNDIHLCIQCIQENDIEKFKYAV